jgi:hypothetical protein
MHLIYALADKAELRSSLRTPPLELQLHISLPQQPHECPISPIPAGSSS